MSVNKLYIRGHNGVTKSSAARNWTTTLFHMLDKPEHVQAFADLRTAFDEKMHAYRVAITYSYPREVLLTKKGTMSARTVDAGNGDKVLIDCLFLAKHAVEPAPYGCQNLQTDDKAILQLTSRKAIGEPGISVDIEIVPLPA